MVKVVVAQDTKKSDVPSKELIKARGLGTSLGSGVAVAWARTGPSCLADALFTISGLCPLLIEIR